MKPECSFSLLVPCDYCINPDRRLRNPATLVSFYPVIQPYSVCNAAELSLLSFRTCCDYVGVCDPPDNHNRLHLQQGLRELARQFGFAFLSKNKHWWRNSQRRGISALYKVIVKEEWRGMMIYSSLWVTKRWIWAPDQPSVTWLC